ncbi:hypothetical protein LINPERHAP1_LOCUS30964, partial [Linum perenne]
MRRGSKDWLHQMCLSDHKGTKDQLQQPLVHTPQEVRKMRFGKRMEAIKRCDTEDGVLIQYINDPSKKRCDVYYKLTSRKIKSFGLSAKMLKSLVKKMHGKS